MTFLNIASGPNLFPRPWINYDRVDQSEYIRILREDTTPEMLRTWPEHQQRLAVLAKEGRIESRVWDLRHPFAMHSDGTVSGIYLGQVVEHLHFLQELPQLLKGCHRMLKPGGWVRITTPDLDRLLGAYTSGRLGDFAVEQPDYYRDAHPADQLSMLMFGATGPDSCREDYEGHMHLLTPRTMELALQSAGFGRVERHPARREGVVDCGMTHSLVIEAYR